MPAISDSMESATIVSWLKQVGDEIAPGDELFEIETDKANMVYEAEVAGTLIAIVAQEGEEVAPGAVVARVGDSPGASAPHPGDGAKASGSSPATPTAPEREKNGDGVRVKASPVARRMAREAGLEVATIAGSGPGGRVVKADVRAALSAGGRVTATTQPSLTRAEGRAAADAVDTESGKGAAETKTLSRLQQTVARRMLEAKASAPHFYLQAELDMSRCVEARTHLKRTAGDRPVPSFNDMVVRACAIALREFPKVNSAYRDGRWETYTRVNIGVAVAADAALVVPTVFDADRKGLHEIAAATRAAAARVRDGSITPPELADATMTISNLGMYGVTNFHPILNLPQAAILAVGAIREAPVIRAGEVTSAHVMGVTLVCDHRVLYGADGAEFLQRVGALLAEPLGLAA